MQAMKMTALALAAVLAAAQAASAQTGGGPGASGARDTNGSNSYGETPSQANQRANGATRADPPAPAETTVPGDTSRTRSGGGE